MLNVSTEAKKARTGAGSENTGSTHVVAVLHVLLLNNPDASCPWNPTGKAANDDDDDLGI
jgi:hypothetical protein